MGETLTVITDTTLKVVVPNQHSRQGFQKTGIDVLGEHEGHGQLGRQTVEEGLDRNGPAQRGAQHPDPFRRSLAPRQGTKLAGRDNGTGRRIGFQVFQGLVHARPFHVIEHLVQQPPFPARIFRSCAVRGLAVAKQNGSGGVFKQVVEEVLPAVFGGEIHHPQIEVLRIQPHRVQILRVGIDRHQEALGPDGLGKQMALQRTIRDDADARAGGGHESSASRFVPVSSLMVLSSSPSWKGLPI